MPSLVGFGRKACPELCTGFAGKQREKNPAPALSRELVKKINNDILHQTEWAGEDG
jgi:hypothetical protein